MHIQSIPGRIFHSPLY